MFTAFGTQGRGLSPFLQQPRNFLFNQSQESGVAGLTTLPREVGVGRAARGLLMDRECRPSILNHECRYWTSVEKNPVPPFDAGAIPVFLIFAEVRRSTLPLPLT